MAMDPDTLFKDYARLIGIGGIAMAGVIGIIKSWSIIRQAVALPEESSKGNRLRQGVRWQLDISMKHIVFFIAIALWRCFLFFWFGVINTLLAGNRGLACGGGHRFPFHDGRREMRLAIVGTKPRLRHDPHDAYHSFGYIRGNSLNGTTGIVASMVIAAWSARHCRWPADSSPTLRLAIGSDRLPKSRRVGNSSALLFQLLQSAAS